MDKQQPTVTKRDRTLSFVSTTYTKRGRYIGTNYFDVPAESYGDGNVTGQRAALELMRDIKANADKLGYLGLAQPVMEAVARAMDGPLTADKSTKGAAVGFMDTVLEYFRFGVCAADVETHMTGGIARQIESNRRLDEWYAERKADSIKRMVATRKAKREAMQSEVAA
jgi:hypothetical protein